MYYISVVSGLDGVLAEHVMSQLPHKFSPHLSNSKSVALAKSQG